MNCQRAYRCVRTAGFALMAGLLGLSFANAEQSNFAQNALAAFRDALFRSTLHVSAIGRSAVDLYWNSSDLPINGPEQELNAKVSKFYAELADEHIAHARLTQAGWKVTQPKAPVVLTLGQRQDVLLLVSNETLNPQKFSLRIVGTGHDWRQDVGLLASETRALYPQMVGDRLGSMRAEIHIEGAQAATIALAADVRPAVRMHVRILDATGNITAARVYLRGSDGTSHIPARAFDRVMWMTGEHYFYSSGEFIATLPAGRTEIEVRKGFDYQPAIKTVDLRAGTPAEVDVPLAWLRDLSGEGWFSGDDHIHGNYTGDQWSTPENAHLIVAAEGLHVGNMMVSNSTGGTIHDEHFFEGKQNALSAAGEVLYWNQEMRSWSYGHLILLNLKRLVRPLYTGFPGAPVWEDYPSNYSQAQQAREQGGVVLYAHPALQFDKVPTGALAGESVADIALGAIDGLEVFCSHDEPSMELWYRFLNLGFKLGIGGGSDAFLNQKFAFLAGGERMYVYTGKQFDYPGWIEGLRLGRTFATVGPLLTFKLDNQIAGSELHFDQAQASVPVQITAISSIPMSRIEVVANGRVIAGASSTSPSQRLQWSGNIPVAQSLWVAARVWGPISDRIANGPSRWAQQRSPSEALLAHSSPIYASVGGLPVFSAPDRDFCLQWLDSLVERIRREGKFVNEGHRDEVLSTFARARKVYERMGTHAL